MDNDIKMLRKSPNVSKNEEMINDLLHDVDVIRKYIKVRFNYRDFLKKLSDEKEVQITITFSDIVNETLNEKSNEKLTNVEEDKVEQRETRGGSGKKIEGVDVYNMKSEGLTLQQIADKLDVNKSTVSKALSKYKKDNNIE
jgi:DNA-binding NarL/FixJ family response regulator